MATLDDFGVQGSLPTHPQLLDYLACELMDHDWSSHHIHRLILESATYQQSSQFSSSNAMIDPENETYWRWLPRRLESEAIRDSLLRVAGQLDDRRGGPSEKSESSSGFSSRRSLYLRQIRQHEPDYGLLFDAPSRNVSCARREVSTNSLQPLWLLNSEFCQLMADLVAQRANSVDEVFRICLHRKPSPTEEERFTKHAEAYGLASVSLVLINSSEFLYIP